MIGIHHDDTKQPNKKLSGGGGAIDCKSPWLSLKLARGGHLTAVRSN